MHRSWLFRGLIISFVLLASWQTTATLRAGIGRDESIIRSATDAPSTVSIASTQRSRLPVRSQSFVYRLFLPMAPDVPPVVLAPILFSDDFSNPSSGWPVADDGNVLRGYNNGEYQILIRQSGWVYAATPGVSGTNVQIDVDLRYPQGGTGAAGIAFDISNDFSSYYALYLDPSSYQIGLFKLANGTWTNLSGWLYSPTIHPGSATNHITVVRNGSTIAPSVNGGAVPAPDDSSYTSGRVGLTAETFSN